MLPTSRDQLYQRVCETPVDTLRKEFGISNVGLGQICRHRQIPVPPRGYWAKEYAGHKMKPPPQLPKPTKAEYGATIHFHREPVVESEAHAEPVAVPPEIAFERDPANAITVPDDLRITHPVLRQQREYWHAVARKEVTWNDQPPHLNIHVSRDSERRAMRLLQALFVAVETRGHSVAATKDGRTNITVLSETFNVSLREPSKQVLDQPTQKEKADAAKHSWMKPPPYDVVPTGELELNIEGVYGSRHRWRDGKKQRLEERLNAVIEGLVAAALLEKEREAKRELEGNDGRKLNGDARNARSVGWRRKRVSSDSTI